MVLNELFDLFFSTISFCTSHTLEIVIDLILNKRLEVTIAHRQFLLN